MNAESTTVSAEYHRFRLLGNMEPLKSEFQITYEGKAAGQLFLSQVAEELTCEIQTDNSQFVEDFLGKQGLNADVQFEVPRHISIGSTELTITMRGATVTIQFAGSEDEIEAILSSVDSLPVDWVEQFRRHQTVVKVC